MQCRTAFHHVFLLFRVFVKLDERQFFQLIISHIDIETITEMAHAFHVHFLNTVSDVFTFSGITHTITFNGLGQDQSWFTFGVMRFFSAANIFFGS